MRYIGKTSKILVIDSYINKSASKLFIADTSDNNEMRIFTEICLSGDECFYIHW